MLRRVIKTNMKRKKRKEKKERKKVPESSFVHKVTMRSEKKKKKSLEKMVSP